MSVSRLPTAYCLVPFASCQKQRVVLCLPAEGRRGALPEAGWGGLPFALPSAGLPTIGWEARYSSLVTRHSLPKTTPQKSAR